MMGGYVDLIWGAYGARNRIPLEIVIQAMILPRHIDRHALVQNFVFS